MLARGELTLTSDASRPPPPDDDTDAALAAFGLVAEALEPPADDRPWFLWPEHVPAIECWLLVQTQWRITHAGVATGLDYAGVEAMLRMRGLKGRQQVAERFHELQLMERATLSEWARQREHQQRRAAAPAQAPTRRQGVR